MPAPTPEIVTSDYNQSSFLGGMDLLGDDSRLSPNQYRVGFDMTNRYDQLDEVLASVEDVTIPKGIKQKIVTFGKYIVAFISGYAYYRYYTDVRWIQIQGFQMSTTAPVYWVVAIPVATTNYIRIAATTSIQTVATTMANPAGVINVAQVQGASLGNLPGLLVQDNITQPQFIFLDINGVPTVRTTQQYDQWFVQFTDANNTIVATDSSGNLLDNREYVPIGNTMAWANGILFIASQDGQTIYRSVSGRPLDFAVNVTNVLVTMSPYKMFPGGDATTTSYSVGVGGISCIRALSTGGIFVSASNSNFSVTLNTTPGAPTIFGEYTFIRQPLFNATCLNDRCIFDTLGDTRFVDLTGVRSFNAIEQLQNAGRNSVFTKTIAAAFVKDNTSIIQDPFNATGILFDNYELYFVTTIFGPTIAKYDTINSCWVSFDLQQTGGKRVKDVAKIELDVTALFAITEDDRLFTLYTGPKKTAGTVRTVGICSSLLYANQEIKMNNPRNEIKPKCFRIIANNVMEEAIISIVPYMNNVAIKNAASSRKVESNENVSLPLPTDLPDVNTKLANLAFTLPQYGQGWKAFVVLTWSNASITQYSMELEQLTPMNPPNSQ